MIRIRKEVFGVTQKIMAEIAGVSQPTISNWENGVLDPTLDAMRRIRREAAKRGLRWRDSFFFEENGV